MKYWSKRQNLTAKYVLFIFEFSFRGPFQRDVSTANNEAHIYFISTNATHLKMSTDFFVIFIFQAEDKDTETSITYTILSGDLVSAYFCFHVVVVAYAYFNILVYCSFL